MTKTLALESTFNICTHHFEFHTSDENHICPYVEHVNTDTITLKSVKKFQPCWYNLCFCFQNFRHVGFIPYVWKVAVLCMLIKTDKPPSQTTGYRPISLLSVVMKLFERVIEKRLLKHLEDNGFFSKYQSGFRTSMSTNDNLSRLSQTIMESFNQGEHVTAAFPDVEKVFNNVWRNGLRYKIYHLDLPTKLCRWLSDFLIRRVVQVKI